MPLQPPNFFGLVDPTNPVGTDSRTISDDYHRMALASLQLQAPSWSGPITATHDDVNTLAGAVAAGANKAMVGVGGATVVYFYNATVPPGWTLANPDGNIRALFIGATGEIIGGTQNPSQFSANVTTTVSVNLPATTGGHALSEAEMPAHGHGYTDCQDGSTPASGVGASGTKVFVTPNNAETQPAGSGAAHTHTIGGTAAGTGSGFTDQITPRYALGVLGQLNA